MSLVSENRIKLMKSDIVEKILKKNKLTDVSKPKKIPLKNFSTF